MTPPRKTQTPIPHRRILQRNPKPHRARRVRVQERAILMRRHPTANLRLLANDHTLQHPRIAEAELFRYSGVQGCEGSGAEGRGQGVQVVAYLVDGAFLGFGELALGVRVCGCGWWGGESIFFEEEADLVAGCEKVAVADVGGGFAG